VTTVEPLSFLVRGTPAPQGSKNFYRGRPVEASKKVKPWREAVVAEILRHGCGDRLFDEPMHVAVEFRFNRPATHYGRHKGQPYLKPTAPLYKTGTPDVDKCLRSTFDALTQSGLIKDDSFIVSVIGVKRYCLDGESEGAFIMIRPQG
jgi:crossover junction endodeoxyribonuclease RusA